MSTSLETIYFDRSFYMGIDDPERIKTTQLSWIVRWGMTDPGVPVAMPDNRKAAVWRGSYNDRNEAPVLAVVLPRLDKVTAALPVWYVGALAVEMIAQAKSEVDAALDAAEHGPYRLTDAVDLLKNFIPPASYPHTSKNS